MSSILWRKLWRKWCCEVMNLYYWHVRIWGGAAGMSDLDEIGINMGKIWWYVRFDVGTFWLDKLYWRFFFLGGPVWHPWCCTLTPVMSDVGTKWVKLAPNGTKPGLFLDQISVNFGLPSWKSDLKKSQICTIWGQFDTFWSRTLHHCLPLCHVDVS